MPARCAAMLAALLLASSAAPSAQAPTIEEVVSRGSAFAVDFFNGLTGVVAEERYVQETTSPRRTRVLRSDFHMVRYPGADAWMAFRDVFEVDGKAVRVQDDRLTKLFVEPPADVLARASAIALEGARYNLRDIGTINNPLFVMAILQPGYRHRFQFNLAGIETDLGPNVRTVRFQERLRPTLLRGNSSIDVASSGLIWMDEKTGTVVRTELEAGIGRFPAEIVTTFRREDALGIHVPAEMRDWYPDGLGEIRGVAVYSRFRRFQVRTREDLAGPSR